MAPSVSGSITILKRLALQLLFRPRMEETTRLFCETSFVRVKWYLQTTRWRGRGAVAGSRTFARSSRVSAELLQRDYQSENFVSPKLRSPTSSKPKHNNMVSAFQ